MKILPGEVIIAERRAQTHASQSRAKNEEAHRFALFESPIKLRGKDGRTYDYIDEDGQYISHYVSQFSPLINENVEPEVLLLVRTLHSMGYLTMGSCQGHKGSEYRWVTLVFTGEEQVDKFKRMVDGFDLPITWYDNFLNFRENPKVDDDGLQVSLTWEQKPDGRSRNLDNLRRQGYTEEELTKYLNIMFDKEEKKYYLTKMVVCSKIAERNPFKRLLWKWRWKQREKVTGLLVEHLLSSEIIEC